MSMEKFIKENWFKIGILAVLLIAIFLYLYPKFFTRSSDLNNQEQCASIAKTFFDYYLTNPKDKQREEFFNHYNAKLDKCFILIKNGIGDGNDIFSEDLFDAIEKKHYAGFAVGVPTWDKPLICEILDDFCKTRDEFDRFVQIYMEGQYK